MPSNGYAMPRRCNGNDAIDVQPNMPSSHRKLSTRCTRQHITTNDRPFGLLQQPTLQPREKLAWTKRRATRLHGPAAGRPFFRLPNSCTIPCQTNGILAAHMSFSHAGRPNRPNIRRNRGQSKRPRYTRKQHLHRGRTQFGRRVHIKLPTFCPN